MPSSLLFLSVPILEEILFLISYIKFSDPQIFLVFGCFLMFGKISNLIRVSFPSICLIAYIGISLKFSQYLIISAGSTKIITVNVI